MAAKDGDGGVRFIDFGRWVHLFRRGVGGVWGRVGGRSYGTVKMKMQQTQIIVKSVG